MKLGEILAISALLTSSVAFAQNTFTVGPNTPTISCSSSTEGKTGIVIPSIAFTCFDQNDVLVAADGSHGTFGCCNVTSFNLAIPGTDEVTPYTCYSSAQSVTKLNANTYQYALTCDASYDGQPDDPDGSFTLTFTASYTQTHVYRYRWPFVITTWTVNPASVQLILTQ